MQVWHKHQHVQRCEIWALHVNDILPEIRQILYNFWHQQSVQIMNSSWKIPVFAYTIIIVNDIQKLIYSVCFNPADANTWNVQFISITATF